MQDLLDTPYDEYISRIKGDPFEGNPDYVRAYYLLDTKLEEIKRKYTAPAYVEVVKVLRETRPHRVSLRWRV
jgi:hypothetical protein